MKKINWFKRLFMSWEDLTTLILEKYKNEREISLNNLKINIAKINSENESCHKMIEELKKMNEDFRKEKNSFDSYLKDIKDEVQKLTYKNESTHKELEKKKDFIKNQEIKLSELKTKLNEIESHKQELSEINEKLIPLNKIEKTFFGKSGNKGKGNLGEKQLEEILKSIDLSETFWTKNLIVGSNQVEFAIKADFKGKWIPVDSKVLEHELDEENKIDIDDKFKEKVIQQVKNVSKYLNKKNTSTYGLLVLQNDELYMKLFDKYPLLFKKMIQDHKIYILSPSSFVQFSWSISQILEIYEKVHKEEELYKEIMSLVETITKFGINVKDAYKSLQVAVNTHYELFEKKQNKLQNNFSESKIKKVAALENKEKYKK